MKHNHGGPAAHGRGTASNRVLVDHRHSNRIRWTPGTRLQHLFEDLCERLEAAGAADRLAVDAATGALTFAELDARANQLARHLLARGATAGMRIGLLCDDATWSYVAMLAVLKINAAYVPMDPAFPADRLAYMTEDSSIGMHLTTARLAERLAHTGAPVVGLDCDRMAIDAREPSRLRADECPAPVEDLAYVIYTSGSTGRPKGVAVEHPSICNFVAVAAECYGIEPGDRMYQGMTIAFDFSIEEIWVPWIAGATLVPKPSGSALVGADLAAFLTERQITALACVPTLLATIEQDLPQLRFLLVSGEACPQDLITRWYSPERRFLNVYGPTEATVSCTWAEVHPARAVTIGVPLPTYSAVILDPESAKALPPGELGELAIAGIGLARGYLNRDDLTAAAFVPDFLGLPENPSGRLYRTGDLCRIGANREIEYHGRIDTQVKIRGYRIELTEIESVLLQAPGIAAVVVNNTETAPGSVELIAYYTPRAGAIVDRDAVHELMRSHLPPYMVPAYLEELSAIPMLPSGKADRKSLPAAQGPRLGAGRRPYLAPAPGLETVLARCLAQTVRVEDPSADAHFFDELGADSLTMARFCSAAREATELPIAMRDVYLNPSVARLAATLAGGAQDTADSAPALAAVPVSIRRASAFAYVACGGAQLLTMAVGVLLTLTIAVQGMDWIAGASGAVNTWERAAAFTTGSFAGFTAVSITAKWALLGRARPAEFHVWGLRYFRFWLVRRMIALSPMAVFVGSPLYPWYLRCLGAQIGAGTLIQTRSVPAYPDLLSIGAGSVILKDATLSCYRAEAGQIRTGPVTLGAETVVGEHAVLDIHTAMGAGSRLERASSLHAGQVIPAGARFAGVPARADDPYPHPAPQAPCGRGRRFWFGTAQLAGALLFFGPVALLVTVAVAEAFAVFDLRRLTGSGTGPAATDPGFYLEAAALSGLLFGAFLVVGLLAVLLAAHLLRPFLRPDRDYPLYGLAYWAQRRVARLTNAKFFMMLFGDSSAIVYWLQALGYRLAPIEQSGSNFGVSLQHDLPWMCEVGPGTMVSDGLVLVNTEYSSTSFRLARTRVGANSYVGNSLVYPATAAIAENCLLATRLLVPTEGTPRRDVGLLGSPAFEIPRSVARDLSVNLDLTEDERRSGLRGKNRHNAVTAGLFLLTRWTMLFLAVVWLTLTGELAAEFGLLGTALGVWSLVLVGLGYWIAVERAAARYGDLRPRVCSILEEQFWRHERFWKLPLLTLPAVFNGTPFKAVVWRALGVRVGRRLFDDGAGFSERRLVALGDDVTLNQGADLQSHSLEDGVFKSDYIEVGNRCTVGVKAFVHYGSTMHDGSVVEAQAFLMKGEAVPAGARWGGNPAREVRASDAMISLVAGEDLLAALATQAPTFDSGPTVFAFDLSKVPARYADLFCVLSPQERREAEEFATEARRMQFVAVRTLVRLVLTAQVDSSFAPSDWPLARTPLGKLILDDANLMGIEIGVTHSDGLLLLAMSRTHRVGIDVEPTDRARDLDVPRFALTDSEALLFAARPVEEHAELFVRLWTIKEAVLKCTGWGLSVPPDRIAVDVDPVRATVLGDRPTTRSLEISQHRWTSGGQEFWVALATAPVAYVPPAGAAVRDRCTRAG